MTGETLFNFEKVVHRAYLDIAAVNSAKEEGGLFRRCLFSREDAKEEGVSFSKHARRIVETDLTTKRTKDTKLKNDIKRFVL